MLDLTLSVSVSKTDTVLEYSFATYTFFVLGFTAIPTGKVFTSMPEVDELGGEEGANDEALALALSVSLFSMLPILGSLSLLLFFLLYPFFGIDVLSSWATEDILSSV